MSWKTISSETLVNDYHVTVVKNQVELPDGSRIDDFYTVTIPDASMVAAITKEGKLLLKEEYRYACQDRIIECPAGMFEESETDPLLVAKRELLEETGYSSDQWTYLGATRESTSKLTNRMYLFLAKNCEKVSLPHLDPHEHLDVLEADIADAVRMVMEGLICANSSAHLILKVARLLGA
jgi:8-oxo-dGTP pyrophosphatase MutT (NUDIX family)